MMRQNNKGFTLIELLVVIGIVVILSTVVVMVINPVQLLKQARDATRFSDLKTLHKALQIYDYDVHGNFGAASTTYFSVIDPTATTTAGTDCRGLGLLPPSGWNFHCAASSTYRNVDGTGWIPVAFTSSSAGSPLTTLPSDPVNQTSTGQYYSYTSGGSWELTAIMEADKNRIGGQGDKTSRDGGEAPFMLEMGSNLDLMPVDYDPSLVGWWKFDENGGSLVNDFSKNGATGTWSGAGTHYAAGKKFYAGQFTSSSLDYVNLGNNTLFNLSNLSWSGWFYLTNGFNAGVLGKWGSPPYYYFLINNQQLCTRVANSGANTYCNSTAIPLLTWVHLAVSIDTSARAITTYVNGSSTSVNNFASNENGPYTNANNFNIGNIGSALNNYYFPGLIDDLRLYNRVLNAAEIKAIYDATK